ncbi:MAG TPA: lysophospholipid acyltransferase family protein [Candidatus Saccharimonadales bacterium]|nr:lysophospholipid acyltransferase family protein [Candidatus Saccharimonadales bacterium]
MDEKPHGQSLRARCTTFVLRVIGRIIYHLRFISLTVTNRGAIPRKGPVIIACNHISVLDPIFLWCVLRRPAVALAMAELWTMKLIRRVMCLLEHIPVERDSRKSSIKVIEDSVRVLKHGGVIIIYPHGRCVSKHENESDVRYREGVYWIAKRSGAPVLAAHISGTDIMMPLRRDRKKGEKKFRLRAKIRLTFASSLLNVGDYSAKDEFLQALRQNINHLGPVAP